MNEQQLKMMAGLNLSAWPCQVDEQSKKQRSANKAYLLDLLVGQGEWPNSTTTNPPMSSGSCLRHEQPGYTCARLHSSSCFLSSLSCRSACQTSDLDGLGGIGSMPAQRRGPHGFSEPAVGGNQEQSVSLLRNCNSLMISKAYRGARDDNKLATENKGARLVARRQPVGRPARRRPSPTTMSRLMILAITQLLPLTLMLVSLQCAPALGAQVDSGAQVAGSRGQPAGTPTAAEPSQSADARDKYSAPVDAPDSAAPSGVGADEAPAAQDEQAARSTTPAQPDQPRQAQQTADADQQLIAAVGALSSAESARLSAGSAKSPDEQQQQQQQVENDVSADQAQTVRKQADSGALELGGLKGSKSRSGKRMFAGHLGVFGRKRSFQSEPADEQQQQQQVKLDELGSSDTRSSSRSSHFHYASSATRAPSSTSRAARVRGEPDDYREILIQPDAGAPETERQQVEQQHVQLDEPELTEPTIQQHTEGTPSSAEGAPVAGQTGFDTTPAPTSTDSPAPGYIRLSNIATINSSSSALAGPNSNNSAGAEMKLMRIYVIDLDQKLVVGGSGPEPTSGPDTTDSPAATSQADYGSSARTTASPELESTEYSFSPLAQVTHAGSAPAPEQQLRFNDEHTGYVLLDRDALAANLSQVAAAHLGAGQRPSGEAGGLRMQPLAAANYSTALEQHEFVLAAGSGPADVSKHTGEQLAVAYQSVPQYIAPQYSNHSQDYQSTVLEPQQDWQHRPSSAGSHVAGKQAPGNYTSGQQAAFVQASSELRPTQQIGQPVLLDKQQADSAHLSVYRQEAAMYQQAAGSAPDEPGQEQQYVPQNPSLAAQGSQTYRQQQQQDSGQWRPVDYSAPAYPAGTSAPVTAAADLQPISPAQVAPNYKPRPAINGYTSYKDHHVVSLANQANLTATSYPEHSGAFDAEHAPLNYQQTLAKAQTSNETYVNNIQKQAHFYQQQVPAAHPSSAHHQQLAKYNGSAIEQLDAAEQPMSPLAVTNEYPARPGRQSPRAAYKQPLGSESSDEAPKIPRAHSTGYRLAGAHRPSAYMAVAGPPVADGTYEESEQPGAEYLAASRAPAELGADVHEPSRLRQRPRPGRAQQAARTKRPQPGAADYALDVDPAHAYPAESQAGRLQGQPGRHGRPNQQYPGQQPGSMRALLSWESISSAARRLPASISSILAPFSQPGRPSHHYPSVGVSGAHLKSAHYDRDVSAFHRPYPLRYSSAGSADSAPLVEHEPSPGSLGLALADSANQELSYQASRANASTDDTSDQLVLDLAEISGNEGATSGKAARRRPSAKKRPARPAPDSGDDLGPAQSADKLEPAHMAVLSTIEQQLATSGARARPQPGTRRPPGSSKRPAAYAASPSNTDESPAGLLELEPDAALAGLEAAERPERPARPPSVQIGQYRITPQTQFVQSIIEPSRQMLGQYLKQYIGQLGQLAGRLN